MSGDGQGQIRFHAAATASCHCAAASARKGRSVARETRWRSTRAQNATVQVSSIRAALPQCPCRRPQHVQSSDSCRDKATAVAADIADQMRAAAHCVQSCTVPRLCIAAANRGRQALEPMLWDRNIWDRVVVEWMRPSEEDCRYASSAPLPAAHQRGAVAHLDRRYGGAPLMGIWSMYRMAAHYSGLTAFLVACSLAY
jgi:hypothetical protein